MNIEERIRQVDVVVGSAKVSLTGLTDAQIDLAEKLCKHFDLNWGRYSEERLRSKFGGAYSVSDRLREAAQHLIYD